MCDCFSGFSFETAVTAAFSLLLKSINSNTCILYSHDSHDLTFFSFVKKKSLAFLLVCSHVLMYVCKHVYWQEVYLR